MAGIDRHVRQRRRRRLAAVAALVAAAATLGWFASGWVSQHVAPRLWPMPYASHKPRYARYASTDHSKAVVDVSRPVSGGLSACLPFFPFCPSVCLPAGMPACLPPANVCPSVRLIASQRMWSRLSAPFTCLGRPLGGGGVPATRCNQ
jgi:hypothetical protein